MSESAASVGTVVSYAGHTIDLTTLPDASIHSLIRKGLTHFRGNEQASKVTTWAKKQTAEGTAPTEEDIAAKKAEFVKSALEALTAGTIGIRERAEGGTPKATPIEKLMNEIAKEQVIELLAGNKKKFPTKKETLKFGDGSELTGADLIARRLSNPKFGPAIRAEAEKRLKAQQRAIEKAKLESEDELLDAIG